MTGITIFLVLVFFSALAFWQKSAVLFLLSAAISLFVGLYWYDGYGGTYGLALGLCLVAFSIFCLSCAFRCLFINKMESEEDEE